MILKTISGNLIKNWRIKMDEEYHEEVSPKRIPSGPMLKWFQIKMSLDDKARLNMLTYPEYLEWQEMQLKKANEKAYASNGSNTFWSEDTAKRSNVSKEDYTNFLSEYNVDVSNRNTVNFDELSKKVNGQ